MKEFYLYSTMFLLGYSLGTDNSLPHVMVIGVALFVTLYSPYLFPRNRIG